MFQISAVIITYNEERNIARCIDSLKEVVDDILVVDSGSTDKTEEICIRQGVRFMQHKWENYSTQKNYGNSQAKYSIILSIDADEALSDELKKSILKAKEGQTFTDYEVHRLTNYCGKWVKHCGWYPDKKLRIFNREKARWDGLIHEKIIQDTGHTTGFLKGNLLHYSYYTLSDHINRVNKFTDISADALFKIGKKTSLIKIYFSPVFKFIRDFFFKLGFLDGYTGFLICRISAHAAFLKYAKLRQLNSPAK
jgi:glycosyltransferase involved in cell wall biosynthesis